MNKIIHEYILFFYRFSMKFIKDIKWDFSQFTTLFDRLNHFVKDDTKILVAVSGWPDSMLVSILVYQFLVKKWFDLQNLYYVHCNHKTRSETDEEELFIRSFFDWLNLSVYTYSGDKFSEDDSVANVKSPYTKKSYNGYVLVVNENGEKKYFVSISDGTFGIREQQVENLKFYDVLPYFGKNIDEIKQTDC